MNSNTPELTDEDVQFFLAWMDSMTYQN